MEPDALNIPAIIIGAVAAFIFGALIYNPRVLGTIWANGSGVSLGDSPPKMAFPIQILAILTLALVVGITATIHFLGAAILTILAASLFVISSGIFLRKSSGALAIDGFYVIGAGALMIAVQGIL
jgi:hypothetical protein